MKLDFTKNPEKLFWAITFYSGNIISEVISGKRKYKNCNYETHKILDQIMIDYFQFKSDSLDNFRSFFKTEEIEKSIEILRNESICRSFYDF